MSTKDDKNDLTRVEDLLEFVHQDKTDKGLNPDEVFNASIPDFPLENQDQSIRPSLDQLPDTLEDFSTQVIEEGQEDGILEDLNQSEFEEATESSFTMNTDVSEFLEQSKRTSLGPDLLEDPSIPELPSLEEELETNVLEEEPSLPQVETRVDGVVFQDEDQEDESEKEEEDQETSTQISLVSPLPEIQEEIQLPQLEEIQAIPQEEVGLPPEGNDGENDDENDDEFEEKTKVAIPLQEIPPPQTPSEKEELEVYQPEEDHSPTRPSEKMDDPFVKEIQNFSQSLDYGTIAEGGHPSFHLTGRLPQHSPEAQDILIVLKNHDLVNDKNEEQYRESLERGYFIIPRINEYCAIIMAHRLKRFQLELDLRTAGNDLPTLSALKIRPSVKTVSRQKKSGEVLMTTLSSFPNKETLQYLGIVSDHLLLTAEEIEGHLEFLDDQQPQPEASQAFEQVYAQLGLRLKERAQELCANAIVGVQYQVNPLPGADELKYKVTCTGNAVLVC